MDVRGSGHSTHRLFTSHELFDRRAESELMCLARANRKRERAVVFTPPTPPLWDLTPFVGKYLGAS